MRHGQPAVGEGDRLVQVPCADQRLHRGQRRLQARLLAGAGVVQERARDREHLLRPAARRGDADALGHQLVAQAAIGDARLGRAQPVLGLGGPAEPPEAVAGQRDRQRDALGVAARVGPDGGQNVLGLLRPRLPRQRAPERQAGREAATGLGRRLGEAGGGGGVVHGQAEVRRLLEQHRVPAVAGLQPEGGQARQIRAAPSAGTLHHVGEPLEQRLPAHRGDAGADDLPLQRMGDVQDAAAAVASQLHELQRLERLDGAQLVLVEDVQLERSARGHELEHPALRRVEIPEPQIDQVGQARPAVDRAAPAPQPVGVLEQAVVAPVAHELAQELRVAARELPHGVRAAPLDGAVQHRVSSRSTSARPSSRTPMRSHSSSFQSAASASGRRRRGEGSPPRTPPARPRAGARARPTRRRGGGRRRRRGRGGAPRRARANAARASASSSTPGVAEPSGMSAAKAPRGSERAARVARTQVTASPRASASAHASVASRVLPTPAAPVMTSPPLAPSASVRRIVSSSASRPTSGHCTTQVSRSRGHSASTAPRGGGVGPAPGREPCSLVPGRAPKPISLPSSSRNVTLRTPFA
jgi:hypothetical protein